LGFEPLPARTLPFYLLVCWHPCYDDVALLTKLIQLWQCSPLYQSMKFLIVMCLWVNSYTQIMVLIGHLTEYMQVMIVCLF